MSETGMRLGLTQPLRAAVTRKFTEARTSQSLTFSDTHLTILRDKNGTPKPVNNKQSTPKPEPPGEEDKSPPKKFDPFEDPSEDLLIARVPHQHDHSHNLVLNKYPVIPNHFILATRENKPQTGLLEQSDLDLAYACVCAWQNGNEHSLYGFFNSGEHSGASQPHRHLQFLPIEDMRGSASKSEWDLLCTQTNLATRNHRSLSYDSSLPVVHFFTRIHAEMKPSDLHDRYLLLLRAAALWLQSQAKSMDETIQNSRLYPLEKVLDNGQPKFSYNLALTHDVMAILPRRNGDATIPSLSDDPNEIGAISINGTILAGTLMVKNETEWEALKADPIVVETLLKQVGFPIERAKI